MERTHRCGQIGTEHIGEKVAICGWVANRRDLGGLIFLDVRDRWGIIQAVFKPDSPAYKSADQVRKEYVVRVSGQVSARENPNPNLPTGEVEIEGSGLEVLNSATLPPFYITDDVKVDENLRLRHRYLDLRRPVMQRNLVLRSQVAAVFRDFLAREDFVEVETPILTRSTPEGARDYLVPSRINPGKFYALPQSPQLFKQLLMVSGLERYYQIARCFRDEDLRADRQPEFTQVDIEASFLSRDEIMSMMETLTAQVYRDISGQDMATPFPRLQWQQAMEKYGTDKPDLRFGMELVDISPIVAGSDFKVFAGAISAGGSVRGIKVAAGFSRKELDNLAEVVAPYGAGGLAWMAIEDGGVRSPISRFFTENQLDEIVRAFSATPGDVLLFVADKDCYGVVLPALGALRLHLARQLDLAGQGFVPCWVVNFPLLDYDQEEQRFIAAHHPFTAPVAEDVDKLATDPESVQAQAYDLVVNGVEIAGGSIRNHSSAVQLQVLKAVGFSEEEDRERFGFLLTALDSGAPPHGGIAFGFDRLVAQLAGEESIRQVIAFPKSTSAADLMVQAPAEVDQAQLEELHLQRLKKD